MDNKLSNLFTSHYAALCNYAQAIVKSRHTAEDIVQTVFAQLWEADNISQVNEPEPYLLKCVKFKCLDFLKKPNRKKEILTDRLPDSRSIANSRFKEEDIMPMLAYFADKLPPRMKQVFLMSRQEDKTYKDIAEELGISVKTVENHMGGALKKMKDLLIKHHYLSVLCVVFH